MKITKKSFIEAMVNNLTTFCGITKRLYSNDEVYCTIQDALNPNVILEKRSCKALSNSIEFSGGSKLGFEQLGKYEFHKYVYPEGIVYICQHTYFNIWDEKDMHKCMYYLVKN